MVDRRVSRRARLACHAHAQQRASAHGVHGPHECECVYLGSALCSRCHRSAAMPQGAFACGLLMRGCRVRRGRDAAVAECSCQPYRRNALPCYRYALQREPRLGNHSRRTRALAHTAQRAHDGGRTCRHRDLVRHLAASALRHRGRAGTLRHHHARHAHRNGCRKPARPLRPHSRGGEPPRARNDEPLLVRAALEQALRMHSPVRDHLWLRHCHAVQRHAGLAVCAACTRLRCAPARMEPRATLHLR